MNRLHATILGFVLLAGSQTLLGASWVKRYNRYNIHVATVESRGRTIHRASYANYTNPGPGHWIIPANSELQIRTDRRGFTIKTPDGKTVAFEYHEQRMGMNVQVYLGRIMAEEPIDLSGFDAVDKQGIEAGKAVVGMTRAGVMTALGYPATHRTASLDAESYVYWTNRFATIVVKFGDDDRVTAIVE